MSDLTPEQLRFVQLADHRVALVGRQPRFQRRVDRMQVAQQGAVGSAPQAALEQFDHHAAALGRGMQFAGLQAQAFGQGGGAQANLRRRVRTMIIRDSPECRHGH